jgi:peroxiredoxin
LSGFANSEYNLTLFRGEYSDTVAQGKISAEGKLTFTMPERYANYCGLMRFAAKGSAWNFIINNDDFSVEEVNGNLIIRQSVENEAFISRQNQIQNLAAKSKYLYDGIALFADNSEFAGTLKAEFNNTNSQYVSLRKELTLCKLYACRYLEISEFVNGYADRLFLPSEKKQNYAALLTFFTDSLIIDNLYTSGLYAKVFSTALKLFKSTEEFGKVMIKKLQQTRSDIIFRNFADDLMFRCQHNSWADAEDMLAEYLLNCNRLEQNSFAFQYSSEVLKGKIGSKAHHINGLKSLKNTLLLFYETDCPHCKIQISEFIKYYPQLQNKNIQTVSISSDLDRSLYEETAKTFLWKNKFCDFKGFEGEVFKSYGVTGTPTIFYIDKNEKIAGRYSKLKNTKLLD